MATCPCPPAALTSVRFSRGVVLVRCDAHEQRSWFLDGRETTRSAVLPVLKELFADGRGERRSSGRPPCPRPTVIPVQTPASYDVGPGAGDDERLTALLRARGLSGTWAVA